MAQSIRSTPAHLMDHMVQRRIRSETRGLGYWAAVDFQKRVAQKERTKETEARAEYHRQQAEKARQQLIDSGVIKPVTS